MTTLQLAQQILDSEFDGFRGSPLDYVRSMGWDYKDKYKNIATHVNNISPNSQDFQNLKSIIESIVQSKSYTGSAIEIHENNSVSDFLCNCIAEKINKIYNKK